MFGFNNVFKCLLRIGLILMSLTHPLGVISKEKIPVKFFLFRLFSPKETISSEEINGYVHLWHRIQDSFKLTYNIERIQIQYFLKKYAKNPNTLIALSKQAKPFLYYIVEEVEAQNMPGEMALLPMLESNFRPHSVSSAGAKGLWQIVPGTGRHLGLIQNTWFDSCKDITLSTKAALSYLKFLHKSCNEDWLLALAAYNSGLGTVQKAIRRNKRLGKPTDFWSLSLPKETKNYVPKFLALATLIKDPLLHQVSFYPLDNKPFFKQITLQAKMDLHEIAHLAEIRLKDLLHLNPGHRSLKIHPKSPRHVLLPINNAQIFETKLGGKLYL